MQTSASDIAHDGSSRRPGCSPRNPRHEKRWPTDPGKCAAPAHCRPGATRSRVTAALFAARAIRTPHTAAQFLQCGSAMRASRLDTPCQSEPAAWDPAFALGGCSARRIAALGTFVAVIGWVSTLCARTPPSDAHGSPLPAVRTPTLRFDDPAFSLEARVGFGTSVGLVGMVGEYSPVEPIALGTGIGMNQWGPIWEVHARLRPAIRASLNRTDAFTIEAAFSRGPYSALPSLLPGVCDGDPTDPNDSCYDPHINAVEVSWIQAEAGWEFRLRSGFSFRLSTGLAHVISHPDWQCSVNGQPAPCESKPPAQTVLAQTIAFGYAF